MGLTGPSLAPDAVATAATRQLLRAETAAEVRSILQAAVHDLGGGVVPADRADETALPVDLALGGGAPLLPTAPVGSAARTALERHVPGLVADARHALDGIARIDHLSREATLDSLTRLGNRTMFNRLLARLGPDDVVVAIDLDEFKEANDTHGHPAGDEVLRAFGPAFWNRFGQATTPSVSEATSSPWSSAPAPGTASTECSSACAWPGTSAVRCRSPSPPASPRPG